MEFCKNCGNEIKGTKFCTKCGTKVEEAQAPAAIEFPAGMGGMMPEKKKSKGGLIAIIIAAVAVVAIAVLAFLFRDQIFGLFGGGKNSPEGVAKAYMEATKDFDAKKIVDLMPDKLVDAIAEEEFDGDKKEMIEKIQDDLDEAKEKAEELGYKISKMKYEIVDVEDVDEEDIEDLNEDLKDEDIDLTVKDAKIVEIEASYPVEDEDDEKTVSTKLRVIKVGNSWYMWPDWNLL